MVDKPQFIASYRQETFYKQAEARCRPELIFTPGTNGSRIHAISIANDADVEQVLYLGEAELLTEVSVNIVPGSSPSSDPWTITRLDSGNFLTDGWQWGQVMSFDQSVHPNNRNDSRIQTSSSTALTMKPTGVSITQQLGVTAKLWRFKNWWNITLPMRSGFDGKAIVSALDETQIPSLDLSGDRYLVIKKALWARLPNNKEGDTGNVIINIMGGDY